MVNEAHKAFQRWEKIGTILQSANPDLDGCGCGLTCPRESFLALFLPLVTLDSESDTRYPFANKTWVLASGRALHSVGYRWTLKLGADDAH